ncbi:MAG: hypothetical protein HQ530_03060 [Parcubacteria group bacterium]|nr:hypothetical protein [Parcubacteria group bacterium]
MDNQADLEKAILSTIVYFDMFDYPLTATEIWQGLYWEMRDGRSKILDYSIADIIECLENSNKIKSLADNKNGFYFRRGREEIIQTRHQRYLIGQSKWQRAQRITKTLRLVPFIRMIAVCNKIAYNNAGDDSDIDLFIIIKPGRIWTTRTLVTIITGLLGVRRHGRKIKDRVCLSFYITGKAMNLEKLSATKPDTHFMYWITQIAPIFSLNETATAFWQANKWIKNHLPNFTSYQGVDYQRQIIDSQLTSFVRQTAEKILSGGLGNIIERKLKKLQLKKMSAKTNSARWKNNTNVVVSDNILKFHERDARMELRREFLTRLKDIYG